MAELGIALVGCGTVGSAVVDRWRAAAFPAGTRLVGVAVRDPARERRTSLEGIRVTTDASALVLDPAVGLVIEASGDTEVGLRLAGDAFAAGKHFVTAGKDLVARHGGALEESAGARRVAFRYEAAVAAAVPIVALLRHRLSPGDLRGFTGVLNGTCNFVLGELDAGRPFADAIREARERGFAEADSRRDTSGRDSADKVAILARLLGVSVSPEDVPFEGIESLDPSDFAYGRRRGWALRLLGTFRDEGAQAVAGVAPSFVPESSLLARARGAENAIVLASAHAGEVGLIGPGAGGAPTATALLADVGTVAREGAGRALPRPRPAALVRDETRRRHYVRVEGAADAGRVLLQGLHDRGCAPESVTSPSAGRFQLVTGPLATAALRDALERIAPEAVVLPIVEDDAAARSAGGEARPAA
jgi:homoserine dehydrogenase